MVIPHLPQIVEKNYIVPQVQVYNHLIPIGSASIQSTSENDQPANPSDKLQTVTLDE